MRRIRAALILAAIVAVAYCARPAAAQGDPPVVAAQAGQAAQTTPGSTPATTSAQADGIVTGSTEFRVWSGGGVGINGPTLGDGAWNIGVRYGWVITDPFLPGPLRGRFEYAVDLVPLFVVYQPGGADYGISFNPVNLKWIFDRHGHVIPYTELDGGVLFSLHKVPQAPVGSSTVNFTPSAAFGAHFLAGRFDWSAEIRYLHISDAGMREPNPGINTLEVRIGFGRFRPPRPQKN